MSHFSYVKTEFQIMTKVIIIERNIGLWIMYSPPDSRFACSRLAEDNGLYHDMKVLTESYLWSKLVVSLEFEIFKLVKESESRKTSEKNFIWCIQVIVIPYFKPRWILRRWTYHLEINVSFNYIKNLIVMFAHGIMGLQKRVFIRGLVKSNDSPINSK